MLKSQAPSPVRGRVIELWNEGSDHFLELICGTKRLILKNCVHSNTENPTSIRRGDIIEALISNTNEIHSVIFHGGPGASTWTPLGDSLRWRKPTDGLSRMEYLFKRQIVLNEIRNYFYSEEFLEVETPLLVKGTCPDVAIHSVETPDGYLVSSTEYQIKRLIVGGFEKVFTLTKNFRSGDRGKYHSSEFTMLEWARAYETLEEIENDTTRLIRAAFSRLFPGSSSLTYKGHTIDLLSQPWEKLSVKQAFNRYLGLNEKMEFSLTSILTECENAKIDLSEPFSRDVHFAISYLLDLVQPHLGTKTPTFLTEWPALMTSSAEINQHDSDIAQRSELYIAGIEISDGFPFLKDARLQKTLFERECKRRKEEGLPAVQIDKAYLSSLEEGIPSGAGMALGVDRLVMVLTGASQLSDVQPFAWDEI